PRLALVNMTTLLLMASSSAQTPQPAHDDSSVTASLNELQSEVRELKDLVLQLKQETTASRAEMMRLRQEFAAERAAAPARPAAGASHAGLQEQRTEFVRLFRGHAAPVDLRVRSVRASGDGSQNQRQRELRCRRRLSLPLQRSEFRTSAPAHRNNEARLEKHHSSRGTGPAFLRAQLTDIVRVVDRACAVVLRQLVGVDAADAHRASHRPLGEFHFHA